MPGGLARAGGRILAAPGAARSSAPGARSLQACTNLGAKASADPAISPAASATTSAGERRLDGAAIGGRNICSRNILEKKLEFF